MISIVQRVNEASVTVDDRVVAQIGFGMVVLLGVAKGDDDDDAAWTANKLAGLRIFRNDDKAFDRDVRQMDGEVLMVSNFTVCAATLKGRRPSLDPAAPPQDAEPLFDKVVQAMRGLGLKVKSGVFQADMQVQLVNDGPVTFIVNSREGESRARPAIEG